MTQNFQPIGIGQFKLNPTAAQAFMQANADYKAAHGQDIPVVSAYRDPVHNAAVGGAQHSRHMKGDSLDIDRNSLAQVAPFLQLHGFNPLGGTYFNPKTGKQQSENNHFDYGKSGGQQAASSGHKFVHQTEPPVNAEAPPIPEGAVVMPVNFGSDVIPSRAQVQAGNNNITSQSIIQAPSAPAVYQSAKIPEKVYQANNHDWLSPEDKAFIQKQKKPGPKTNFFGDLANSAINTGSAGLIDLPHGNGVGSQIGSFLGPAVGTIGAGFLAPETGGASLAIPAAYMGIAGAGNTAREQFNRTGHIDNPLAVGTSGFMNAGLGLIPGAGRAGAGMIERAILNGGKDAALNAGTDYIQQGAEQHTFTPQVDADRLKQATLLGAGLGAGFGAIHGKGNAKTPLTEVPKPLNGDLLLNKEPLLIKTEGDLVRQIAESHGIDAKRLELGNKLKQMSQGAQPLDIGAKLRALDAILPGGAYESPAQMKPRAPLPPEQLQELARSFNARSGQPGPILDQHGFPMGKGPEMAAENIIGQTRLENAGGIDLALKGGTNPVKAIEVTSGHINGRPDFTMQGGLYPEDRLGPAPKKPQAITVDDVRNVVSEILDVGQNGADTPAADFLHDAGFSPTKPGGRIYRIGGRAGTITLEPGDVMQSLERRYGRGSIRDAVANKIHREKTFENLHPYLNDLMQDQDGYALRSQPVSEYLRKVGEHDEFRRLKEEHDFHKNILPEMRKALADIDKASTSEELKEATNKALDFYSRYSDSPMVEYAVEEKMKRAEQRMSPPDPKAPLKTGMDLAEERLKNARKVPDLAQVAEKPAITEPKPKGPPVKMILPEDLSREAPKSNVIEFPGKAKPAESGLLGPNGQPIIKAAEKPVETVKPIEAPKVKPIAESKPEAGATREHVNPAKPVTEEMRTAMESKGLTPMDIADAQSFVRKYQPEQMPHLLNALEAGKNNQTLMTEHRPLEEGGRTTNTREVSPVGIAKKTIKGATEVANLRKELGNQSFEAIRDNLVQRLAKNNIKVSAEDQQLTGNRGDITKLNALADKLPEHERTHVYIMDHNLGETAREGTHGFRRLDRITDSSLTGKEQALPEGTIHTNKIQSAYSNLRNLTQAKGTPDALKRVSKQLDSGKITKQGIKDLQTAYESMSKEDKVKFCKGLL